ncbi:ams1 Alpha-mannosidase [Candida maltosa Xu316]|uniref:Alpha-mannosidase n=1 Tax=Candida maltosa (strain Xu316) TaxID=1245528 RepID=M3JZE4_CANMX|nr:hypothetical protein G210_1034 [Candida maltosa Xu316]
MGYENFNLQPNFKPIDHLYDDRLRQFTNTGGQFHNLNLPKFYDIHRKEIGNLKSWKVPDDVHGITQRPLFKEIDWENVNWDHIGLGYNFGPSWKTFWVKFDLDIPEDWLKYEGLEIDWDSSSEALIYNHKGLPLQAFTGGGERNLFSIPKEYRKTGTQTFYIEVACNGMFGNGAEGEPDPNRYFRLNRAHLVVPNLEARRLFWDFWILGDATREFPGGQWQKYQAADICTQIMNTFDPDDVNSIAKCRKLAEKLLGDKINSDDVFHEYPNEQNKRIDVYGIGNCHIDTAWEWPFAETKRKIVRSWTTQIKLADDYPEYIFVASQMQQFKWLKQYHPEIMEKVHEKFATNQFIPVGGTWVENDTNIPNGESLLRQFIVGQRYLLNEFGFQSDIFWLPDTFGYSSQIPQICQLAGIHRFLTQKLSWNNINSFPLSTFNWKGIDGSQLLVHMPPANTYTAAANFGDVVRSSKQHKNLRDVPAGMLLYGHGDGGGGPTEEMIEKLRRCRGLANNAGLIPSVHLGSTVDEFYDHLLAESDQGRKLPTWTGEIYLEYHRGTYTTHADVKKFMRFGEIKLHDLELIAGLVSLKVNSYTYPGKEILDLWEDLLLCQFHDVLPGSCIGMVYYDEVYPMMKELFKKADALILKALKAGGNKSNVPHVVNTLPWDRHNEIVDVNQEESPELYSQLNEEQIGVLKQNGDISISVDAIDGVTQINSTVDFPASVTETNDGFTLSNKLLTAKISSNGVITSLFDEVSQREVIDTTATNQTTNGSSGKVIGGNQLLIFDDQPLNFPAWDTELYSLEKFKFVENGKAKVLVNNGLEASIVITHELSQESSIETVISLAGVNKGASGENNYIKFSSTVNWHETYKFLKVQFPTTIYTAQQASYETQFGITTRATHWNTTWDVAKFEVAHHKFMDLSEYNYGVSILNNSKYGGAIHGNLIRLSLLRSAKAPDNKADMGVHKFEYAIFPHAGPVGVDTVKAAYNFNYKLLPKSYDTSYLNIVKLEDAGSLVLSHIKRGENDVDVSQFESLTKKEKSIVVRVYESLGGSSKGTLVLDKKSVKVDKVFKTDGLENELEELKVVDGGKVDISLRGFEIATFKILLKD